MEKEVTSTMYKQLLDKMDKPSTPTNATADPIVAVYLQPDQFPLINPKTITDPVKIFFHEADWKANKKKTHSEAGHCPSQWGKANTFTTVFFYHAMRASFPHFRLCEYDWKASQFVTKLLPQWQGKPKDDSVEIKVKPTGSMAVALLPESKPCTLEPVLVHSKCPPMEMIGEMLTKKSRMAPAKGKDVAVQGVVYNRRKYLDVKIMNPLSRSASQSTLGTMSRSGSNIEKENFKATPNERIETATSSRLPLVKPYPVHACSPSKVTTMLQCIVDGMETPINEPLTVSWMPKPCLLKTKADSPASSTLAGAPELEPKKKRVNPNAVLHITKSSTAWNLCTAAYKAEKGRGRLVTSGEYETYWNALTAEEKQPWIDKETKGKGKASDRKEDARAVESG
ncbi:hypothetical protein PAXRUDRAFT_18178 [Paxillus rubicundulus Ve08.2h10]|uniref:Uncharacterized protein n=1 Tax=Paxillus rubicundulus Ve08.2h10 TaxID=930991 RepID=A0A0D0BZK1_9AGAM|nr:hypothetical protein PAXRUDRAFT_18178 [Paxillus rubicundulus Ve08.2h10]